MLKVVVALAPFALSACLSGTEYVDPTGNLEQFNMGSEQNVSFVGTGTLVGDIGPVKNIGAAHPVTITGYDDGTCTYVTLEGVGDNGTGTMIIDVMPRADEMADGTHGIGVDDETFEGTSVS